MRSVVWTCDECGDEDDSTRHCEINHGRVVEAVDLCSFCRGEIAGVSIVAEEESKREYQPLELAA